MPQTEVRRAGHRAATFVLGAVMMVSSCTCGGPPTDGGVGPSDDGGEAPLDAGGAGDGGIEPFDAGFIDGGDGALDDAGDAEDAGTNEDAGRVADAGVVADGGPGDAGTGGGFIDGGGPAPLDPFDVLPTLPLAPTEASPIDPGVFTPFHEAYAFLVDDERQVGLDEEAIAPLRMGVVRGQVFDRSLQPLEGATVTVVGHPELGAASTRADGRFDVVVNGGERLTLRVQLDGYFDADRPVDVGWGRYPVAKPVVLVPRDPLVTVVETHVDVWHRARASVIVDAEGRRQSTLLFAPQTGASLRFADGSTQALDTFHVRATEYTVGATGYFAMPAPLPPASLYTHLIEFSLDEAQAAGAIGVVFDRPVLNYQENYLDLPVGAGLPIATYDVQKAAWVPSSTGRILAVVDVEAGLAVLDLEGDGQPSDASSLAAAGISDEERAQLAQLYAPGLSLWRAELLHFSPHDLNRLQGFVGEGGFGSNRVRTRVNKEDECRKRGSIIEPLAQVLGETLPLAGSSVRLTYRSDEVRGRTDGRVLELAPPSIAPDSPIQALVYELQVAGRRIRQLVDAEDLHPDAAPFQPVRLVWDGVDGFGRPLNGSLPATLRVDLIAEAPVGFPAPTAVAVLGSPAGSVELPFTEAAYPGQYVPGIVREVILRQPDQRALPIGEWMLDVHHRYDPIAKEVRQGDGTVFASPGLSQQERVVGNAANFCLPPFDGCAAPGSHSFLSIIDIVALPSGEVMFSTGDAHCQIFVSDGDTVEVFAGRPCGSGSLYGDGLLATEADLVEPTAIARGPDGTVYVLDRGRGRVRAIDPNGVITTAIGDGTNASAPDFVTASTASIQDVADLAVAPSGDLYFTERTAHRVRFVGQDGLLRTLGGTGAPGDAGDGGPVRQASFNLPGPLAFDREGALLVADVGNQRVRRVTRGGRIDAFAGGGQGSERASVVLDEVHGLDVADDGTVAIAQGAELLQLAPEVDSVDVARMAVDLDESVSVTRAVAYSPDGSLLFAQQRAYAGGDNGDLLHEAIFRTRAAFEGVSLGGYVIVNQGGTEIFSFDESGRHLQTRDAFTGAILWTFTYDGEGPLAGIVDGYGNESVVERDSGGEATAFVGPFGARTELDVQAGSLVGVHSPSGDTTTLSATAEGLLTALELPSGALFTFTYDAEGRLASDTDPDDVEQTLEAAFSDEERVVTQRWPTGVEVVYRRGFVGDATILSVELGSSVNSLHVDADQQGLEATFADGTVVRQRSEADSRLGGTVQRVVAYDLEVPAESGGLTRQVRSRYVDAGLGGGPFNYTFSEAVHAINGREYQATYFFGLNQELLVTPAGRQVESTFGAGGQLLSQRVVSMAPYTYGYDAQGRLVSTGAAGRQTLLSYRGDGTLLSAERPDGELMGFDIDTGGRLTRKTLADGREILWDYDEDGRLVAVTPPGRPAHVFTHTEAGRRASRSLPPVSTEPGETQLSYDADGQLVQVTHPGGESIVFVRDPDESGRVVTIDYGAEQAAFAYDDAGRLTDATSASGVDAALGWAGELPASVAYSGPFTAAVTMTYNHELVPTAVDAGSAVSLGYDQDLLLTQVGTLTLQRDANTGLVAGTQLGQVVTSVSHSSFGEPTQVVATAGGNALWQLDRVFDVNFRLVEETRTTGGTAEQWSYLHDAAGRLTEVSVDGALAYSYTYDDNGNLLEQVRPDGTLTATYDDRDRLVSAGAKVFGYDSAGFLESVQDGPDVRTLQHGLDGTLRSVTLADGTEVAYLSDHRQQRVGRLVDGVLTHAWPRDPLGRVAAELDGSGAKVSTFWYDDNPVVPAAMERGGRVYRLLRDHRGSVRFVVDTTDGSVAQELQYDPYGRVLLDTQPGFQPFGFAGGLYDPLTGWVRMGVREYQPELGRFTSADPLGFVAGSSNLYRYADNDPVSLADDGGYIAFNLVTAAVGAVVGGLVNGISSARAGKGFFKGAAIGAAAGAVAGFALNPLLAGSIIGGLTAAGNVAFDITKVCGPGDALGVIALGAVGGALGGAAGAAAGGLTKAALGPVGRGISSPTAQTFDPHLAANLALAADQGVGGVAGVGFNLATE